MWVEMELAYKARAKDFSLLWGVDFKSLNMYLVNKNSRMENGWDIYRMDKDKTEEFEESEDIQMLISFMKDGDSPAGDLAKLNSWGLVKRDGKDTLVLIDFGLSNDVYTSYYS